MFTVKLIENKEQDILYIKELNNCLMLDDGNKLPLHLGSMTEDELLSVALEQSEEEYERFKKLIASWERLDDNIETGETGLYTICLHPVRRCNFKCHYCFAEKSDYLPSGEITVETAKKAIDFMTDDWGRHAKRYVVDISGSGEPLLRSGFIKEIEEYCEKKRKEKSKDIKIMFPSNASLITEENVEYFTNNGNILIGISIDGNEGHNSNRRCMDGGSAFEKTAHGIDLLKNRKVGLAATVTHINEDVDEVYDFLYHRFENADAISLNLVRDFEKESITSFYDIDIDNLLKHYGLLLDKIYDNLLKENYDYIRKIMIGTDTLGIYLCRVFSKGVLFKKRCGMAASLLSVDGNGTLYACSVTNGNKYFMVGDIEKGIDRNKSGKFTDINVDCIKACKDCWAANICSGECHAVSYLTHGDVGWVNEDMCKVRKGLVSLAVQFACRLRQDFPAGYHNVLNIVKTRNFFEGVVDSGIWAVQEYIKDKKVEVDYSDIVKRMESTSYGTEPKAVLKTLSLYCDGIAAYKMDDVDAMRELRFPAIAFVNKAKTEYYQYVFICGVEADVLILRKQFAAEKVSMSARDFVRDISDIFIF